MTHATTCMPSPSRTKEIFQYSLIKGYTFNKID